MHRFRRVLPLLLLLLGVWQIGLPVQAQDNLLKNPNFENPYGGIGTADGWDGGAVKTPHTEEWMNLDPVFTAHRGDKTYEGQSSQQMGRQGATFTAAVWQKVDNIQAGTRLRFSVWVYYQGTTAAGAKVRVGIDSNNTASPLDDMTWSPLLTTFNAWQQLTVEATVPAGYVTVYIFGTQDWALGENSVYMDQATLTVVGTGQPVGQAPTAAPGSTSAPAVPVVPTTRPQVYAPSVSAQDKDAADGIVHTVQSGDTLAAIAVAYGTTVTSITELNGIDRRAVLTLGQQLIIKKPEAPSSDGGVSTQPDTVAAAPTTAPDVVVPAETTVPSNVAAQPTDAAPASTTDALAQILGQKTPDAPVTTEEAVAAPTQEPATAAPQATNTTVPTATEAIVIVQPTSTVVGTSVAEAVTSLEAGVCVTLFDDENQNRFQESSEPVLPGGMITLRDVQGKEVDSHLTTATSEPHCFTDIPPATYNLGIVPPDGYGLTTTSALTVNVQVGAQFQVNIGAAKGVTPLATPTLDTTIQSLPDADVAAPSSGVLVLIFVGLIAVVAIGAGVLIFVIRRL